MTENTPKQPKAPAAAKKPAVAKPATAKADPTKAVPTKTVTAKTAAKPASAKATPAKAPATAPAAAAPAVVAPAVVASAVVAPTVSAPPTAPAPATPTPPVAPPAPVPMLESDARMWAMLLHVLAAAALVLSAGTLAFLVPLVIWLMYRDRSALIDHHGKQNLNLQLTSVLVIVVGSAIGLITLGFGFLLTVPLMLGYGLYALIISIVAGVKANNGEYYAIPASIRFIR